MERFNDGKGYLAEVEWQGKHKRKDCRVCREQVADLAEHSGWIRSSENFAPGEL